MPNIAGRGKIQKDLRNPPVSTPDPSPWFSLEKKRQKEWMEMFLGTTSAVWDLFITIPNCLTNSSIPRAKGFYCTVESRSGKGEDFLSRQQDFFMETAVTSEQKVEKSLPR